MSWSQFANLINDNNRDISAWKAAIEDNPNTPEGALEIAINHFIRNGDVAAIDDFCSFVVSLVNQAVEQNAHLTPGSRPVFCVCCGGEVTHPVCVNCLPSPAQVA